MTVPLVTLMGPVKMLVAVISMVPEPPLMIPAALWVLAELAMTAETTRSGPLEPVEATIKGICAPAAALIVKLMPLLGPATARGAKNGGGDGAAGAQMPFIVASTGSSGPDLVVSAVMANSANTQSAAGIIKAAPAPWKSPP